MDLYSQQMIREAKDVANQAQRETARHENALLALQARVETLTLTCRALWTFVQETAGKTDPELVERVVQLRREKGEKAQSSAEATRLCPKCRRPVAAGQGRCLYCGSEVVPESVFDRI